MLVFAAITPHPPIIIPGIGKPADLNKVKKTINAMEKLSDKITKAEPDTIIIISPHALVHPDKFAVYASPKFHGDFGNFNAQEINFNFENDLELANEIVDKSTSEGINSFLFGDPDSDYFELDHGEMVPLYYLTKKLRESVNILPIAYSNLDRAQHFSFGQIIKEVCDMPKFKNKRIAIIASGDLSHRLLKSSAGFSDFGRSFDNQIVEFIKYNKVGEILDMDDKLLESAGECGYRSIIVLEGSLENLNIEPEILSYEGPFGVGYLVCNFNIEEK